MNKKSLILFCIDFLEGDIDENTINRTKNVFKLSGATGVLCDQYLPFIVKVYNQPYFTDQNIKELENHAYKKLV